ncbi:hypothetical protein QR680_014839 [Steinernema hermaphroditum]|uniref:RING-type domain-containing protein n=1 Tax=Steinernema hermaphroditum TaxID=289476 RepID=A0AA39M4Y7_9BILA|nr:hypothetical protein QR680_014839 [Steinernema hermaphroditum]
MGTQRLSCPICFNVYDEHSSLSVLTGCGHLFHTKCIEKWLDGNLNCPSCRTGLEDRYASLLRVYSPTALCSSKGSKFDSFDLPLSANLLMASQHQENASALTSDAMNSEKEKNPAEESDSPKYEQESKIGGKPCIRTLETAKIS